MRPGRGAPAEILDPQDNLLEDLTIIAPPADTPLLKVELLSGRWIQPGDQRALVVAIPIYNLYPDLKPGDMLRLRVADGRIEDWEVIGVFSFTEMLGSMMAYADYDYFSDLIGAPGEAASYRMITDAHTLQSQKAIAEAIDSHMRSLNLQVQNVEAGLESREQASLSMNIMIAFLMSMALLTAFVGAIGLAGTMGMNVIERTREIGVMRAIGAGDLTIIKSVVIEGALIGLISWACAWVLSYPITAVMLRIISEAMESDPVPLAFTLQGVLWWLGVVLLLSSAASMLPARAQLD